MLFPESIPTISVYIFNKPSFSGPLSPSFSGPSSFQSIGSGASSGASGGLVGLLASRAQEGNLPQNQAYSLDLNPDSLKSKSSDDKEALILKLQVHHSLQSHTSASSCLFFLPLQLKHVEGYPHVQTCRKTYSIRKRDTRYCVCDSIRRCLCVCARGCLTGSITGLCCSCSLSFPFSLASCTLLSPAFFSSGGTQPRSLAFCFQQLSARTGMRRCISHERPRSCALALFFFPFPASLYACK
jgi:hypothetical protein